MINKSKDANKLGGSRCTKLITLRRSILSSLKSKECSQPREGGREKFFINRQQILTVLVIAQWNCQFNLEQFAWTFIASQTLSADLESSLSSTIQQLGFTDVLMKLRPELLILVANVNKCHNILRTTKP